MDSSAKWPYGQEVECPVSFGAHHLQTPKHERLSGLLQLISRCLIRNEKNEFISGCVAAVDGRGSDTLAPSRLAVCFGKNKMAAQLL